MTFQNSVNPADAYYRFGRAMKQYAIAQWISLAMGVIYFIVMNIFSVVLIGGIEELFGGNSYYYSLNYNPAMINMASFTAFVVIMSIFSILTLGVGILQLVRYIQYLLRLKEAANISQSAKLQAHYKWEITTLIMSIVLPIVIIIALFGVFIPLFISIDTNYYISLNPLHTWLTGIRAFLFQDSYMNFLGVLILIVLVILILALVMFIFRVLSAMRLDDWAAELVAQNGGPSMIEIKEGTNLIKWGVIIAIIPIANYFSTLVYLIGLTKAGKAIENTFAGGGGISSGPEFASYTTPSPGSGTTLSATGMNSTTMAPTSKPYGSSSAGGQMEMRCPYCGALLPSKDAKFCGTCGNAVR